MISKPNDPEESISTLCRIHLKAEAWINTAIAFLIALPVLAVVYGVKVALFIASGIIPFLTWIVEKILVPVIAGIWRCIAWICRGIVAIIRSLNWCAIRSLIRIGSIISAIVSCYVIINGILTIDGKIITGRFYDSNPEIYLVHIAIVVLMLAIGMYYNAWAYARPEEVSYVCNRTWGFDRIRKLIEKKKEP